MVRKTVASILPATAGPPGQSRAAHRGCLRPESRSVVGSDPRRAACIGLAAVTAVGSMAVRPPQKRRYALRRVGPQGPLVAQGGQGGPSVTRAWRRRSETGCSRYDRPVVAWGRGSRMEQSEEVRGFFGIGDRGIRHTANGVGFHRCDLSCQQSRACWWWAQTPRSGGTTLTICSGPRRRRAQNFRARQRR